LLTVKEEGLAGEVFEEDLRAAEVLVAAGRGLLGAHAYSAAGEKFRRALTHDATLAPALEGLAEVLEHLGRRDEATSCCDRLAALASGSA
jgi:Flp pilus assembly protein TadD